jgi:hypothetical protein
MAARYGATSSAARSRSSELFRVELFGQSDRLFQNLILLLERDLGRVVHVALEPYCDLGAPGQSVLKSGLAMSVTCRLYLARIFFDSPISASLRSITFLPHMERSSIQLMPKSCEAT